MKGGKLRHELKTFKTISPGDGGSKGLFKKFGRLLVAVRYRRDVVGQRTYKTAEIIIWEKKLDTPRLS